VELLGAGETIDGMIDVYPTKQKTVEIPLEVERINKLLGINVSKEEMIKILNKLDIKVENDIVKPPFFRQDIEQTADVAEEILRFYGYDKLETTLVSADTTLGGRNKKQTIEENISNLLVHSGLSEICTYGFVSESDLRKCNISKDNIYAKQSIKIKNPLSEDYTMMKTTSVPSMMQ